MTGYEGVEIQLILFFTLALDAGKLLTSALVAYPLILLVIYLFICLVYRVNYIFV